MHRLSALLQLHLHSRLSTWFSSDWAKTTARRDETHLSLAIWCVLYKKFYGIFFIHWHTVNNTTVVFRRLKADALVYFVCNHRQYLTSWGRGKMTAVSQTTLSNAFSWVKMLEFRLRFHWSLFLRVQLTIIQHWFRQWLGAGQVISHYLNQWWLVYRRIYASLGLNELTRDVWTQQALVVDQAERWHRRISYNTRYHTVRQ